MEIDRITDDDLDRHQWMTRRLHEAEALQRRAVELASAYKVWCEELHERYDLALDGSEGVEEDGTIKRANSKRGN